MKMPYMMLSVEDDQEIQQEMGHKLDEFLDVYSLYLQTKIAWVRDEVKLKAYELHLLDPAFSFQLS
jgi:hypothetical protein